MKSGGLRRRTAVGLFSLAVLAAGCGGPSGAATAEGPDLPITKATVLDGEAWQLDYASDLDASKFTDVAVVSADEAWAVGFDAGDDTRKGRTLFLRLQDSEWKPAPTPPGLGEEGVLVAHLEASGPDNVWAFWVDLASSGLPKQEAARWDGVEWRKVPADPNVKVGVTGVTVIASDDVWTLSGRRSASHWDGEEWHPVKLPAKASAIDGRASDDVWAVGTTKSRMEEGGRPVAMHWDGESWTKTKTPTYLSAKSRTGERAGLNAVTVVSEREAWALGTHASAEQSGVADTGDTFLMRWDGERWWKAPKAVGGNPRDFAGPKLRPVITGDEHGGVVLAGKHHWNGVDEVRTLKVPAPAPEMLPEQPQKYDRHLRLSGLEPVPGGRTVLGVGEVVIGSEADGLHSTRAVIVTYDLPE